MKKIIFITYPWFLDFSLEYIMELSKHVELHVIIVTKKERLKSTVLSIKQNDYKPIIPYEDLKNNIENSNIFDNYFANCKDVNFYIQNKNSFSLTSFFQNYKISCIIKKITPDIIHFDDLSTEILFLKFFIPKIKTLIDIHDPIPHIGEKHWRRKLLRCIYLNRSNGIIAFSQHSYSILSKLINSKIPVFKLSLTPYYSYSFFKSQPLDFKIKKDEKIFLFFGRITKYKGVENLVSVFKKICDNYENVKLIIAGKSNYNFFLPEKLIKELKNKLFVYNKFITNEELKYLMENTHVVICPYTEATQSGVVMTALAFEKFLIVSDVGGLPEDINSTNGIIYSNLEKNGLENAISSYLTKHNSSEKKIATNRIFENTMELLKIYNKIL